MDEKDDIISYDIVRCRSDIEAIRSDIDSLVEMTNKLVNKLFVFQTINHDMEGSAISEDYKDLGIIFGDQGFNNYVNLLEESVASIEETLNNWEKTLSA